jgi:exosortase/archaeosortase family protein
MDHRKSKILGIAVLFVAFLLASVNSIAASSSSVLDTDPSTYVIVVMLMIFVFMLFSLKEDLKFEYKRKNMLYAAAAFAAYLLLLSYLRVALSFAFQSYRVDALLFPLVLAAMITALFGLDGTRKMKYAVAYAVFASPLILLPILSLNNAFARANAMMVYGLLKAAGMPVSNAGLMISAGSASSITISTTCVSLGIFAAFVMFLIPVAYLYEGRIKSKALWLFSGCVLLLFLNVLRMFGLSLIWVYYGVGSAANTFHAFAGQILFYIAIAAMVLLAYRYGLHLKKAEKGKKAKKPKGERLKKELAAPAALAVAFGAVAFLLSSQYGAAAYAPALFFDRNMSISNAAVSGAALKSLESAETNIVEIGPAQSGYLFALQNNSVNSSTYVIATPLPNPAQGETVTRSNATSDGHAYMLRNGITLRSEIARSGNVSFEVNYFALPYNFSNSYITVNYELFREINNTNVRSCDAANATSEGLSNYVETAIYGALHLDVNHGDEGIMCESYRIAGAMR